MNQRPKTAWTWLAIGTSAASLALLVAAPMALVLIEAFGQGAAAWWQAVSDAETLHALRLSLGVVMVVVPINTVCGIAAAWWLARYPWRGRSAIVTLLDLPLSVSPVVAGLLFVLLLGSHGWWGAWLEQHGLQMLFAWPAIVLATLFVTLPMVAREVLPLLQSVGAEADWAAVTLGASGWQLLWRVILPQVRWAILYGVLLTSSRALGEFGAVSVVSGHIRGETNTLPLHIEVLYAEYHTQQAFAVASLLVFYGLLTLALRRLIATRLPEGVRNGH